MRIKLGALLAATALLAGSIVAAVPAQAVTSVTFAARTVAGPGVPEDENAPSPHNVVPVGTVDLTMAAGQTAYVVSVMRVNAATIRTLFDNEIICKLPDGTSKNMVMGQNVYESTNPATTWTDVTLTTRYLVQAPVAGKVICTAQVRAHSLGYAASTFRLVSGSLRFADQNIDNGTDGKALQQSFPAGLAKVDATTPQAWVPALDMFDIAPGFKGLSVFGDTEYMVCHTTKTAEDCNTRGASTAKFTLYINQWKQDGSLCKTDDPRATIVKTVPYAVHHIYVPLNKPDFLVSTAPGCIPRFNAYVKVEWLGGETGAVQGVANGLNDSLTSTTKHSSDMSHVYVVPYH